MHLMSLCALLFLSTFSLLVLNFISFLFPFNQTIVKLSEITIAQNSFLKTFLQVRGLHRNGLSLLLKLEVKFVYIIPPAVLRMGFTSSFGMCCTSPYDYKTLTRSNLFSFMLFTMCTCSTFPVFFHFPCFSQTLTLGLKDCQNIFPIPFSV